MIYIFLIGLFIYLARFAFMYIGSNNERRKDYSNKSFQFPFISVVVAARNEENNISDCIKSLIDSTYPKDKYEIIIVNDRSNDGTKEIINNLSQTHNTIVPIHLSEDTKDKNLKGKPGAIQAGADIAKGEIIMMTDADCRVHHKWIETIAAQFADPEISLVPSYTLIEGESRFEIIQAVEWMYMHTMACAGVGMNVPLGNYGNNLSIRTKVFRDIGGYRNIKFSVTEDLALQTRIFEAGNKIHYMCNSESTVTTKACSTFREYMRQHKRWAIGGMDLGWKAVFFVAASLGIWSAIAVSIIELNPFMLAGALMLRFGCDFALTLPAAIRLKQFSIIKFIVPSVAFFMLIELIIPFTVINKKVNWKGQVFNSSK